VDHPCSGIVIEGKVDFGRGARAVVGQMIEDATVVVTEIEIEKEEEVDQDHTPEDTEDKKDDQGQILGSNQDDKILEKKLDTKGADHDQSQNKDAEACHIIR
jgi:hypothetical protein